MPQRSRHYCCWCRSGRHAGIEELVAALLISLVQRLTWRDKIAARRGTTCLSPHWCRCFLLCADVGEISGGHRPAGGGRAAHRLPRVYTPHTVQA